MDLRVAGKLDASLAHLLEAHRTYPTPITGLELGRAYMLLGKLVEARDTLESVARIAPRPGESARAGSARAEAAGIAAGLGDKIPRIVFRRGGAAPAVTVDGAPVSNLDVPFLLDPGPHTIAWDGTSKAVTLAEGHAITVELSAPSIAPAPAASPPIATSPAPAGTARGSTRAPFWIAVGLTGAATAVGAVSGVVALGDANTARPGCPGGQCQPSVHGPADAAKTWSTVSTASFVTAGVLGVASVVLFLVTHDATKETALAAPLSLSF